MITCAFVPLMPNDDTPARRRRPPEAHGCSSVSSDTPPADQSAFGVGSSTCSVRGSVSLRSAMIIFSTPPTPAAACVCPRFDFSEPSHSGRSGSRSAPYTASSDSASIGSPSIVPVPWPSTASTSDGASPASASAERITRSCDGPFGAVNPFDAPSWFTAEPVSSASTRCPLRRASDRRSNASSPTPSDHPVPSAAPANDLHRPSADNPRWRLNSTNSVGVDSTVTPPASASEHSPRRSDCAARCSDTSDDEHAVSTVTAGPSKPNVYAIRPDATLPAVPTPQ